MFGDPFRSLDQKGVGITYTIMTNFLKKIRQGPGGSLFCAGSGFRTPCPYVT